eukprot:324259-Rhodomonas_salina.6
MELSSHVTEPQTHWHCPPVLPGRDCDQPRSGEWLVALEEVRAGLALRGRRERYGLQSHRHSVHPVACYVYTQGRRDSCRQSAIYVEAEYHFLSAPVETKDQTVSSYGFEPILEQPFFK